MRILGMMAGTSLDGIDAALCDIEGSGATLTARTLAFDGVPYEPALRERLLRACSGAAAVGEVALLNVDVAEAFAKVALASFEEHGRADFIASHGQTIAHYPADHASLQIGEGAVIAERTGATVVCNFRARDLAAGGQGAPLVPYADWVLLRHATKHRIVLNIGGIANCTVLPAGCALEEVRAWDTGPGNMAIDHLARQLFGVPFDADGALAAKGVVDVGYSAQLARLHPFFAQQPPKSAGREQFGAAFATKFLEENAFDALANATFVTAHSIAASIAAFADVGANYEMIVGGGGVHNATLMRMLRHEIAPATLLTHEAVGLNSDAKEALAFAILGAETLRGVPTSIPGATGASASRVLGQIVPGVGFNSLFALR